MPKIFGREMPTVVVGGAGVLVLYLAYSTFFSSEEPATTSKRSSPPIKKSTGETDYLDADYTFKIEPLADTPIKDSFKPLVFKQSNNPGGIPSIDNYTYSGMAQLNGVDNGLLENGQTGQGDFVQPGQRWHDQWLVVKIDPNQIELKNDGGDTTVLQAGAAAAKAAAATGPAAAAGANGNSPYNPMMVGPIGGPDMTLQLDPTQGPQGNGRQRRRGGRGGGGRGGGGGGNGGGGNGGGE